MKFKLTTLKRKTDAHAAFRDYSDDDSDGRSSPLWKPEPTSDASDEEACWKRRPPAGPKLSVSNPVRYWKRALSFLYMLAPPPHTHTFAPRLRGRSPMAAAAPMVHIHACGLGNLGNTCYANSVIQALRYCRGFSARVKDFECEVRRAVCRAHPSGR
jgi:hypothetical protein